MKTRSPSLCRWSRLVAVVGIVFPEWGKSSKFVNGLIVTTKTLLARCRKDNKLKLSFEQIFHCREDEGEQYRARMGTLRPRHVVNPLLSVKREGTSSLT